MCAIIGGMSWLKEGLPRNAAERMRGRAQERGRDGSGMMLVRGSVRDEVIGQVRSVDSPAGANVWLENHRAIPTTEMGGDPKLQQQPLHGRQLSVVHNGTIANDHELWSELGLPGSPTVDSAVIPYVLAKHGIEGLGKLRGSYALAAYNHGTGTLLLAANYKPLYIATRGEGFAELLFASEPESLPEGWVVQKLAPYTYLAVSSHGSVERGVLPGYVAEADRQKRVLVVASGGLDSTVAAAKCAADGYAVTLLHVQYEAQAQARELQAVTEVAAKLGAELLVMQQPLFVTAAQSPLTTPGAAIAKGITGAEFAHEWVPARNLVLAATAVAVAEARGIPLIALGNNLEESGAYPDNEPEFVRKLNELMPNAVADGGFVRFIEPVGNLMKHEIAQLGAQLGAPVAESWSCYKGGDVHCGECGPCFMRRRAHEYAGVTDPTVYASR